MTGQLSEASGDLASLEGVQYADPARKVMHVSELSPAERNVLRFLKQEYLTKGGKPTTLDAAVTYHRDVKSKFGLSEVAYREIVARLESWRLVKAIHLDAENGYLSIKRDIVRAVDELDKSEMEESPMFLEGLLQRHGEEFRVKRNNQLLATVRGLRNEDHGKKYISFLPGIKPVEQLKAGDVLTGLISQDQLRVYDTDSEIMNGKVFHIMAFYESEAAYQQRVASQHSTINVQTMTNSAIQQNSHGSTQVISLTQVNKNDAATLIATLRAGLGQLEIDDAAKNDLVANIETAEAQLKRSSPSSPLIRAALEGVQSGLQNVIKGGATAATISIATGLTERVREWLERVFS